MAEEKPVSTPNASLGKILGNLTTNSQTLVRKEVELVTTRTKERITEQVASKAKPIGLLVGAAIFALFALGFLGVMLIFALQDWVGLSAWLAALIVMLLYLLVALVLALVGRYLLKKSSADDEATEATATSGD